MFLGLVGVGLPASSPVSTVAYVHSATGQRIAKYVDGNPAATEKYFWRDLTTLLAVCNGDDSLRWRFEYSTGRVPDAMTDGSGVRYYLLYDQVDSLRAVVDAAGAVVKRIDYDAFGNILADTNPAMNVPFGYAGGLHDRDTGLVRFGYRDYDPEVGRWTAIDPLGFNGGDTNLYAYVFNNPISLNDPTGLNPFIPFGWGFAAGFVIWEGCQFLLNPTLENGVFLGLSLVGGPILGKALGIAAKGLGRALGGLASLAGRALGRAAGAGVCFVAGTLIHTPHGLVPIEDIEAGDRVLTRDEATGEVGFEPVADTFVTHDQRILQLELTGDDGASDTLGVTGEHPFWVADQGWVEAQHLTVGDRVLSMSGGYVRVGSKSWTQATATVYNFEVANTHTYFVGETGAWVHNSCAAELTKSMMRKARRAAVREAWKQEQALVAAGNKGTTDWSESQIQQLLQNGKVRGFEGHHINSVNGSPHLAGNPNNVKFVTRTQHFGLHMKNWRNPTTGSLLDRSF